MLPGPPCSSLKAISPLHPAVLFMLLPSAGAQELSPLHTTHMRPSPLPAVPPSAQTPPPSWPSAPLCQPTQSPGEISGRQVSCSWLIQMERDQGQHSAFPQEPAEPHATSVCSSLTGSLSCPAWLWGCASCAGTRPWLVQ